MNILISENQYKSLLEHNVIELKYSDVKTFEKVLKKQMQKRFDWFVDIDIKSISVNPSFRKGYFAIEGVIKVDSEWGANQWREYHYSLPIPDADDDELNFGNITGGELSKQIQEIFLTIISVFTGFNIGYTSFSWLMVKFVERDNYEDEA